MTKWAKDSRPEFALSRIEQIRVSNSDGSVAFQGFHLDEYVTLLVNCIDFDSDLSVRRSRNLCHTALFSHDPSTPLTPSSFFCELAKAERELLGKKVAPFWICTRISLRGLSRKQFGRLGGVRYTIEPGHRPYDQDIASALRHASASLYDRPLPRDYLPVWAQASGVDAIDAGQRAMDALDSLRGLWNYTINAHASRSSSGPRRPANPIMFGPIHTLHDDNKAPILDRWLYEPSYAMPITPHNVASTWAQMKSIEADIRHSLRGRWYATLVWRALRQYARALDDHRYETSFLNLWSVMESLTLTGLARYDETIARAAMVFSESDYIRVLLSSLRKERNALVHTDAGLEAAETSMYQLKSVVDGLLRFWFGAARRLRSEAEVQMFLQLPPAALTLKRRKAVLETAIRYRRG